MRNSSRNRIDAQECYRIAVFHEGLLSGQIAKWRLLRRDLIRFKTSPPLVLARAAPFRDRHRTYILNLVLR
jgi:hypothetical protein